MRAAPGLFLSTLFSGALLAAAAAPAAAAKNEIGRACDSAEHCLPQNQLRYYEVLRQALGQPWRPPDSAVADSGCTPELDEGAGAAVHAVRAIGPRGPGAAAPGGLVAARRAADAGASPRAHQVW